MGYRLITTFIHFEVSNSLLVAHSVEHTPTPCTSFPPTCLPSALPSIPLPLLPPQAPHARGGSHPPLVLLYLNVSSFLTLPLAPCPPSPYPSCSFRPLMRENKSHYAQSFAIGKPLAGGGVGLVRVSKAEGECVVG